MARDDGESMSTERVVNAVEREYSRLIEAIDAVERDVAITEEGWTTKDVVAHCIHWLGMIAFGLGAELDPPSYVIGVDGPSLSADEWNARAVAHYADWC